MKNISNITQIQSGILFKEGIKSASEGNIRIIQLKDVDTKGNLNTSDLQQSDLAVWEAKLVRQGDVIFKAKTNHPVAVVIKEDLKNTIVTAHYFILRIKDSSVLPGYLAWYLNQKPAQMYFDKHAGGTRIQVVNMQALGNLSIAIPSLEVQKKIVSLYDLHQREETLVDLLKEKKRLLIENQLLSIVEK